MNAGTPIDPESRYDEGEKRLSVVEPSWAKAALFFRTGNRFGHGRYEIRTRSLLKVHEELEARRKRVVTNGTMEILHAIALCAEENVPLPTWVAIAFKNEFEKLLKPGGATSLDEIFSSKRLSTQTAAKAATAQIDWALGRELWANVWKIVASPDYQAKGIDPAVKQVLALGRYGVGPTKAKRLVNMIDETQHQLAGTQLLSRFIELRRKK